MKWDLEAVGRLIITLILMGFAIAFMFKFPEYSWGAVFFVTLIVLWDFMYYKDFKYLKFGKNGLEAKANSNGIFNIPRSSVPKLIFIRNFKILKLRV